MRLRATSPTYGAVIITIVNEASADKPGQNLVYIGGELSRLVR